MMETGKKYGIISVFAIVMSLAAGRAEAFPLVWTDIGRIGTEVMNGIQQVTQIKNEIDSNIALIREAQERGYAAAAQDLFNKVQNGEFDRFGNELSSLGDNAFAATHGAQAVEERQKKLADKLKAQEDAKKAAASDGQGGATRSNEPFGKKIYKWLKENRATTDAGFNTLGNIQNGDVSNAIRNATGGADNVIGGGIGTIGSMAGAGTDIINNSGNIGDAVSNTMNNGELRGAIDSIPSKDNNTEPEK